MAPVRSAFARMTAATPASRRRARTARSVTPPATNNPAASAVTWPARGEVLRRARAGARRAGREGQLRLPGPGDAPPPREGRACAAPVGADGGRVNRPAGGRAVEID